MDGKPVARYSEKATVNSTSNAVAQCFKLKFNTDRDILSLNCPAYASSTNQGEPAFVTDAKPTPVGLPSVPITNGFM